MRKNQRKNTIASRNIWMLLLIAAVALMIAAMLLTQKHAPVPGPVLTRPTTDAVPAAPQITEPAAVTQTEPAGIELGQGLFITDLYNYSGIYMEDGTNDAVVDVMMLLLHNGGTADLQYLELELYFGDQVYTFQATDLASGSCAVLLEQERKSYPGGQPDETVVRHAAFFEEDMQLHEDVLQIQGLEGVLNVTNISDRDIVGDIYICYKYAGEDLFYGGITFRARIPGLKAGEIYQMPTGHYAPESCVIVQVTIGG